MKKAQVLLTIVLILALAAVATVALFFGRGIIGSTVLMPKNTVIIPPSQDALANVRCEDSDNGFNLFEAGRATLIIDDDAVIEMTDRCLFDDSDIAETVCDGYEVKQVKSRCPVLEFPDESKTVKCIETESGAKCETCEDYGLVSCDGKCC